MKILVLGGTKFIGRAIVETLIPAHEVTVLNRGMAALWDNRIKQLVADRTNLGQMSDALAGRIFDAVVDVSGTEGSYVSNTLAALPEMPDVRYVFISSAAVYNRKYAAPPFRETDRCDGDDIWGTYGTEKADCERLLHDALGPMLTVLRPPYVYGPRNTEQREQFLWARMMSDSPIFVPGDGQTRIQFCHVGYLARLVAKACAGELAAGTYNVGESQDYSLIDYIGVLSDVAGREPHIIEVHDDTVRPRDYFPFRKADLVLDVAKVAATNLLEDVPLASGLPATLAWFRQSDEIRDEPTAMELKWRANLAK